MLCWFPLYNNMSQSYAFIYIRLTFEKNSYPRNSQQELATRFYQKYLQGWVDFSLLPEIFWVLPAPTRKWVSYLPGKVAEKLLSKLLLLLLLSRFSHVQLCAAPWTAAHQAPLSLGFSRQEYWSGLPFPSPMHACMLSCFNCVWFFATLRTAAHQAPLSPGFSTQEYWSGLPFPSPSKQGTRLFFQWYLCLHKVHLSS